ncbi:hypothetical protein Q5P01_017079 [Channa striata]|uniref:Receptor activity modifying protein 2 n=1 Tax=Channa striata TaxID=64152 RepID=A0AA88M8W1_CHASR|nr:hypothetical protein Q5P01_017079 [Channa striata]
MTATTFSLLFSGCYVTLLILGCRTVVCLVDEKLGAEPATTVGNDSMLHITEPTYGHSTFPLPCGNSERCAHFCQFCWDHGIHLDCLPTLFDACLLDFVNAMDSQNSTDWCIWSNVRGLYSNLSHCTEEMSDCLRIPWPNPLVEQTFVKIHSEYFIDCPTEELSDPPSAIVFALVVTPICLIPVMVSLVVLKTKNGDGSS